MRVHTRVSTHMCVHAHTRVHTHAHAHAHTHTHAHAQDKRPVERARLSWDLAAYEAKQGNLTTIRRDLVQKRRWARQVGGAAVRGCSCPYRAPMLLQPAGSTVQVGRLAPPLHYARAPCNKLCRPDGSKRLCRSLTLPPTSPLFLPPD